MDLNTLMRSIEPNGALLQKVMQHAQRAGIADNETLEQEIMGILADIAEEEGLKPAELATATLVGSGNQHDDDDAEFRNFCIHHVLSSS